MADMRLEALSAVELFAVVCLCASGVVLACPPAAHAQWWSGHGPSGASASRTHYSSTTSTIFSGRPATSTADKAFSPSVTPGVVPYYNNAGMGYYRANPTAAGFPAYTQPVSLGGGYYQLGGLTQRLGYWRAASGFYYPWIPAVYMPGVKYDPIGTIYAVKDGVFAPARPTVGQALADMREYIETAKDKKQLDEASYQNFYRRVNELTQQATDLTLKDGGTLSPEHELTLRQAIDLLGADLARTLNP